MRLQNIVKEIINKGDEWDKPEKRDMTGEKDILILNNKEQEKLWLGRLLGDGENRIFDTGDPLEAFNLLQKENIGLILASRELTGMDRKDFKSLVEKIRPGVSVILTSPFTNKDDDLSVNTEEFFKLITGYTKKETAFVREISNLKRFSYAIVDRLLQILGVNDKYFFNNDHLVAELSRKIAEKMGLKENLVEAIQMGALLRDLGRVAIQQQILDENKKLTQMEQTPIRAHPVHTVQILRQVPFPWNLDCIISQHHEHYDGSGYPLGLKGRQISIGARIICVVEAYFAMTTDRPYRRATSREKAIQEIKMNAGKQFDPEVMEVFLSIIGEESEEKPLKKSVLIFERASNVAAMIKLSTTSENMEVTHVTTIIDVISSIRQKKPNLIIADVEALESHGFMKFYNAVAQPADAAGSRFLLMIPDKEYLKRFDVRVDYIIKSFSIDELLAKIRNLLFETPGPAIPGHARGITGGLGEFSLTDIIQILSLGLKTAKVEIIRGEERGTLYLRSGKIVYVSTGDLRGRDAFFELIGWQDGNFHIIHGQVTDEVNITADTTYLLLEGATNLDEKAAAAESLAGIVQNVT
jgi:HD-GYP domain-containing protein (c-di-GMP phosphodiesterase class II)/DNA-binding response OmpR family regulator